MTNCPKCSNPILATDWWQFNANTGKLEHAACPSTMPNTPTPTQSPSSGVSAYELNHDPKVQLEVLQSLCNATSKETRQGLYEWLRTAHGCRIW